MPNPTVAPATEPLAWMNRRKRPKSELRRHLPLVFTITIPTVLAGLLVVLLSIHPHFYESRVHIGEPEEQKLLSKRFLTVLTRFISDVKNAQAWNVDFDERQINAWLAEDFLLNHAETSLPPGVSEPRVSLEGEQLRLGFCYRLGPLQTVLQIGMRAWVPKRNVLVVEFERAQAGLLPLPTNYTRHVFERFAYANNLEISWKRNGNSLVAVLEFPRGGTELVLQQLEIRRGGIKIAGTNGRVSYPSSDFAPSAN